MSRTVAIVQARLRSRRLPGKVLKAVLGRPLIGLVLERLSACRTIDEIVLTTGTGAENDRLAEAVDALGYAVARGPEDDVLRRCALVAADRSAEVIVRVTGDCPLVDPGVVDRVVTARAAGDYDFATNVKPARWPDGLDVAVFTRALLDAADLEAERRSDREHVVPWMWRHSTLEGATRFSAINVEAEEDRSALRWTVDEPADFEMLEQLAAIMGTALVGASCAELLAVFDAHPELARLNAGIGRDEGLARSLAGESVAGGQVPMTANSPAARYHKSLGLLARAELAVPAQTQTFSKGWTQFPRGAAPVFATRADGAYLWDADGNKLIDWPMALGPLLLGHNHPAVNEAVRRQLEHGIAFSLPTVGELELAERLIDWFDYAERVRFGKNGSDATSGAVRAARAHTGRDVVLCCGYHGWQDWFIGTTTRGAGVPAAVKALTHAFAFNDLKSLDALLDRFAGAVAAIVVEPVGAEWPAAGFLEGLRERATQHGAVLVFDECWTGFRVHPKGAHGRFGVAPDLACFGKALGNGVPISVVLGRAEFMDVFDEIFFSFTFGGDMLGIVAANAVLDILEERDVAAEAGETGKALWDGIEALVARHGLADQIGLQGYELRSIMTFGSDDAGGLVIKSLFQQEALARGVLAAGWHAPSLAHGPAEVAATLDAYDAAFGIIAEGIAANDLEDRLAGAVVQPVFRNP